MIIDDKSKNIGLALGLFLKLLVAYLSRESWQLWKTHACVVVLSKMAEDGNSGRRIVE